MLQKWEGTKRAGFYLFFFQAEDGIRDLVRSRGLGDVYKRQHQLEVENGRYTMRLYVRERNADRELTREQAGEWCDTVRVCGGYVRRGGHV